MSRLNTWLRNGLAWLDRFSLDVKLAARLLAKYPLLTLVATVGIAFGIGVGVGGFQVRTQMLSPSLPLDEGSRIVGLRNWDVSSVRVVPVTAADLVSWREQLTRVTDVSASSDFHRNLITRDGRSEVVQVAAMTASAFRVARVLPRVGRTLVEADEQPGAQPVIVIGHTIWRERFAGAEDVVGQTVRLGHEQMTVVGVMPDGYAFPLAHDAWIPLRVTRGIGESTDGPALTVFGRLADRASAEQANAELNTIARRTAIGASDAREHVRAEVVPYARLFYDSLDVRIGMNLINAFLVVVLLLVAGNVALLIFARASSRESEIAVRSALGAARRRIVAQLFVESLVLTSLAAGIGVIVARVALASVLATAEVDSGRRLPFWATDSLTPTTVIYALVLTIVSATIIGVLPAMKITATSGHTRLRESTAGGGGYRFGGIWTVVIALQVAITLMFPAVAFFFHRSSVAGHGGDVGFATHEYLSARLAFDRDSIAGATEDAIMTRIRATYTELERRVVAEPVIAGVTFADRLPGTRHPDWPIELDEETSAVVVREHSVASASVALNFFDVLGAPVLAGRGFTASDLEQGGVVIVNQAFVSQVMGGKNPIGRRVRRGAVKSSAAPRPWLEIVGVVRDLGTVGGDSQRAGLYQPVSPERASALRMAIHVRGRPETFAARLRAVAGEVEPALQIHELLPLDAAGASDWIGSQYMSRLTAVLSVVALLLSLSTIYAVLAFTVSKRSREIGIRVTLGADRRRLIGAILRRPIAQVSLGIVLGSFLVAMAFVGLLESAPTRTESALIVAYSVLMMGVCLLACIVPTRRALGIQPADVFRADT